MKKLFIKDLCKEQMLKQEVSDVFFIQSIERNVNGTISLDVKIVDKTGEMNCKVWYDYYDSKYLSFKESYAVISGTVGLYKGKHQLEITKIEPYKGKVTLCDFAPSVEKISELYNRFLDSYKSDIKKPHCVNLIDAFYKNKQMEERFKLLQGAKAFHHVKLGGYMLHVIDVYFNCLTISNNYQHHAGFDQDILLTAAALHDVGKIYEYRSLPINSRTDGGILIGHLLYSFAMVYKAISDIPNFPCDDKIKILHCIATSHGEIDTIKLSTIEAQILHHCDSLDSKIDGMKGLIESSETEGNMTEYSRLLDMYVYKK